jgi:uncharacterized protein (DUF488 family)
MIEALYTIGVYGSTEASFFDSLVKARIDLFVDIRIRRGLRGHTYAYANSTALQQKLKTLKMDYLHYRALAPTTAIKQMQEQADAEQKIARRQRDELIPEFIAAYKDEILAQFDLDDFLNAVSDHRRICLFCVEHDPAACHRSLAAAKLQALLDVPLEHLMP